LSQLRPKIWPLYSEWGKRREGGNSTANKLPNYVQKFGLCTVSREGKGGRKKYCKQVAELLLILLHLLLFRSVLTCNGIIIYTRWRLMKSTERLSATFAIVSEPILYYWNHRVHCNFTGDSKCNERGWACTPHAHQPGLILPS
jgi:hypothetical protein